MPKSDLTASLLDNDFLAHDADGFHKPCEDDDTSSGYGSSDSLTPPSSPTSRRKTPSTGCKVEEVMIYSNTESLSDSLQFILDMPELCDVTFLVGDAREPVHGVKAIIATRSRIFYQLILHHQRKLKEAVKPKSLLAKKTLRRSCSSHSTTLTIPIADYDKDVFSSLICFLHSGKVKVQMSTVIGLSCAAIEYGLKDLQRACYDFMRRCKTLGYIDVLISSSERYSRKKCLKKVLDHLHKV